MKIVKFIEKEDCIDGTFIQEIVFDRVVKKEFIFFFGKQGKLQYYPTFAKPYYRIDVEGRYIVMGVEGNRTARIVLYKTNLNESQKLLHHHMQIYSDRRKNTPTGNETGR